MDFIKNILINIPDCIMAIKRVLNYKILTQTIKKILKEIFIIYYLINLCIYFG